MLSYPVKIRKKARAAVATCPDFPEVAIDCADRQDAMARASDVLEAAIAVRMAHHDDVPTPSAGRYRAALPNQTTIKVWLYQAVRERGVSKRELGRRLKCHGPQVDRLFDLKYASRLDRVEAAFDAVGLRLCVDVKAVRQPRQAARAKSPHPPSHSSAKR